MREFGGMKKNEKQRRKELGKLSPGRLNFYLVFPRSAARVPDFRETTIPHLVSFINFRK